MNAEAFHLIFCYLHPVENRAACAAPLAYKPFPESVDNFHGCRQFRYRHTNIIRSLRFGCPEFLFSAVFVFRPSGRSKTRQYKMGREQQRAVRKNLKFILQKHTKLLTTCLFNLVCSLDNNHYQWYYYLCLVKTGDYVDDRYIKVVTVNNRAVAW